MESLKNYNIGLDIGVGSCGWCITDENSNILKKGKKHTWGSHIFDEAKTAKDRRMYRGAKRRLTRRRERINILQSLLLEDLEKEYPNFLPLLRESSLTFDDKTESESILGVKYNLFSDKNMTDKTYFKEFPTIYHLRKNLMDDKSKADIRLVYLAIHHIIKYRGNFLYEGKFNVNDLDLSSKLKAVFRELSESVSRLDISLDILSQMDYAKMENIIMNKSKNDIKVDLKNELKDISENKKFATEFGKLITGGKFVVKDLFMIDSDDKLSISFSGNDFDDKYLDLEKM